MKTDPISEYLDTLDPLVAADLKSKARAFARDMAESPGREEAYYRAYIAGSFAPPRAS